MKSLLLVGAIAFTTTLCHARIGETPSQIATRYGKPLKTAKPVAPATTANVYRRSEFGYFVGFINDKAVYEIVQMVEEDGDFGEDPVKPKDIVASLSENADGDWVEVKDAKDHKRHWKSADGKVEASYDEGNNLLRIETVEFADQRKAAKKK